MLRALLILIVAYFGLSWVLAEPHPDGAGWQVLGWLALIWVAFNIRHVVAGSRRFTIAFLWLLAAVVMVAIVNGNTRPLWTVLGL